MAECSLCGCSYKLSSKDKLLRKLVEVNAQMYPALKTIVEDSKDYCNACYKERILPSAHEIAGVKPVE